MNSQDLALIRKLISKYGGSGGGSNLKVKNVAIPSASFTLIDGLYRADVSNVSGNIQSVGGFNTQGEIIIAWTSKDDSTITIATDSKEDVTIKILYI